MCLPPISVTFSDLILFGSDIQSSLEPRKFLGKFLILVLGPTTFQATSGFGFEVEAEVLLRVVVRVGEVGTRTPATGRRFGVRRHRVHRAHRYFELWDFQKRKENFSENFFEFKFVSLFHFMSAFDVSRCFVSKLSKSRRSRRLHRSETTNTRQWDSSKAFDRQQQQKQQQKMGVSDELQTLSKTSKNVRK